MFVYHRLTYMMMDENIVAVSPSSVYRTLKNAGQLSRWNGSPSKKGAGFEQSLKAHEHWHTDISYINISGTFYYLCSVLDGFSRYIMHCEISESMTEADVETILQRARGKYPDARPRIISDNGPQFIAKDFKEFIRLSGMTHVRTSPYYPQSNGKLERWHGTIKHEGIRPGTPLNLEDARRIVAEFVAYYNNIRLHSAIGFIAPKDKLAGRAEIILVERERKLSAAREARKTRRRERNLTARKEEKILLVAGETDASNAGGQLARDNRLKDEIARLKQHKGKPKIPPSRLEKNSKAEQKKKSEGKRPGPDKRSKTKQLTIHETIPVPPKDIPPGSTRAGHDDWIVQALLEGVGDPQ